MGAFPRAAAGDPSPGVQEAEAPEPEPDPAVEIVVHGDPDREDPRARTTLGPEDLDRRAGGDLGEVVEQVPGVVAARGTADATKPMIRGQPERRLVVLNDGIRHESQKWGPDHATEIDPFAAGSIAVIRGAAGARYGPDAIGGVILVEPPAMRAEPGVGGRALGSFASNGRRGTGALRLDAVPAAVPGLALRAEGSYGRGASLAAPGYVLGNTGSEAWNLGAAARYRWRDAELRATWHHYDLRAGVFYGVRHASPAELEAGLVAGRPADAELWSTTYAIDRPYQDVRHDIAALHADAALGAWGDLAVTYAFQVNRREEYEQVRQSVEGPQYDFTLRTHSLDAAVEHHASKLGPGWLEGGFGLQASFQENVYRGLPLLPNHRALGGGLFAWERLSLSRIDVEAGGRADGLWRTAWLGELDLERHLRRGTLDPGACDPAGEAARCPSAWRTGSVSLGGLVHLVPERLDLKLDLSSASRFPNADEQYLIGHAPSFPVFAVGDPGLGVETTRGGTATLAVHLPWLEAEGSAWASRIDRYVSFAPDLGPEGEVAYEVTVRGAYPRYAYRPIDAVFHGADGALALGPEAVVGLDLQGALVRASDAATGRPLAGIPADHARIAVVGRPPGTYGVREPELAVVADLVARARTDPAADFGPPPGGYVLLGASASARLHLARREVTVGVEATNLTDAAYREVTSLLRYYADQPGRDVRLWIGSTF